MFQNKAALVTGGASGIGRALALELSQHGNRVVVADCDLDAAKALADTLPEAKAVGVDVLSAQSVVNMVAAAWSLTGGIDLVFANAGVSMGAPLLKATPEAFDWMFGVNVRGAWLTCQAVANRLIAEERPGWLCLTGSEHSFGMQHTGAGLYTGTKHAVLGMADVLRHELPERIGISVFCPGVVSTELHRPSRFGRVPAAPGAAEAFAKAVMDQGMPADEVARLALKGVARGDFLIVTHGASRRAAALRADEIAAAFTEQAPLDAAAKRYDVADIIARTAEAFHRSSEG